MSLEHNKGVSGEGRQGRSGARPWPSEYDGKPLKGFGHGSNGT